MSSTLSFDAHDLPDVDYTGRPPDDRKHHDPRGALRWAYLPMIITLTVNAVFFVAWWVPEFARFPGHDWLYNQLTPLASATLTSQGQPVSEVQIGRGSLIATFLLVASLPLPALFRARSWQLRLAAPALLGYLGAMGLLVNFLSLLARRQLPATFIGLLLLLAWVAAIGITIRRLFWVNTDDLPRRPTKVLWIVVLVALLHPLAIAIGRRIFAPELRTAVAELQASGQDALLNAALIAPATIPIYLSGVAVVLVAWAWYMMVPPWQPIRTPWKRRSSSEPRSPLGQRLVILAVCVVFLALSGATASYAGQSRAQQIEIGSPAGDLALTCASWEQRIAKKPTQTVAFSGTSCNTVTAFRGFAQVGRHTLSQRLSPLRAETPDEAAISGRVIGAQYGAVVVVASADGKGFQAGPDQLQGIRIADGQRIWTFRCDDDGTMQLRFAQADGGNDPATGRITELAEPPSVIAACSNGTVSLDPQTGKELVR
ncbi:MAG: hypothetical protein QM650_19660 [Microlunatus sp.]